MEMPFLVVVIKKRAGRTRAVQTLRYVPMAWSSSIRKVIVTAVLRTEITVSLGAANPSCTDRHTVAERTVPKYIRDTAIVGP